MLAKPESIMFTDQGDRILEAISRLMKAARAEGLPRTEEALADALLTVFNALGDDCRERRPGPAGQQPPAPRTPRPLH